MTADARARWRGDELFARADFLSELQPREGQELAHVAAGVPPSVELAARVAALQETLEHGTGAALVKHLGTGEAELTARFKALTTLLGTPVSQSPAGDRVLRVQDEGFAPGDPRFRGPHSNRRLSFHTDRCDVIAFCCVRPASAGGENHLLSSLALREALAARDPAHVEALQAALPYLRHVVDTGNQRPFTRVPVFTQYEGRFAASLLRVLIDRADASPDAPDLTPAQRAALDALEEVAEDPSLYATLRLEPGDVLLLNNWVTMHRRTAFEDAPDPAARRLLLRAWLSPPNTRALDPRFAEHFGATEAGTPRGGIHPRGNTEPGPFL